MKTTLASDKFVLRLPDGMRTVISQLAAVNARSMNAEILVALVNHAMRHDHRGVHPDLVQAAFATRLGTGEIQQTLIDMGQKMQGLAKQLDQIAAAARDTPEETRDKKGKPAG
ncbi:Arc family DNA-binding protein [Nitrobacter sp. TKz-YC02]|uniref:Arc family DNA-binding protein n=1 Tax=Nitrobacter sp. TKz-YC02 TaxID=3398704 RepID=UPI003CE720AE